MYPLRYNSTYWSSFPFPLISPMVVITRLVSTSFIVAMAALTSVVSAVGTRTPSVYAYIVDWVSDEISQVYAK